MTIKQLKYVSYKDMGKRKNDFFSFGESKESSYRRYFRCNYKNQEKVNRVEKKRVGRVIQATIMSCTKAQRQ